MYIEQPRKARVIFWTATIASLVLCNAGLETVVYTTPGATQYYTPWRMFNCTRDFCSSMPISALQGQSEFIAYMKAAQSFTIITIAVLIVGLLGIFMSKRYRGVRDVRLPTVAFGAAFGCSALISATLLFASKRFPAEWNWDPQVSSSPIAYLISAVLGLILSLSTYMTMSQPAPTAALSTSTPQPHAQSSIILYTPNQRGAGPPVPPAAFPSETAYEGTLQIPVPVPEVYGQNATANQQNQPTFGYLKDCS